MIIWGRFFTEEKGLCEDKLLIELQTILSKDVNYDSGKILSSMCSSPIPITKKASEYYLDKNLGDPFLFPGSERIEKQTITILSKLLSNNSSIGNLVSGGTEANITALWVAKNNRNNDENEVIITESAHFSFDRAANLLGLKLIKVPLNNRFCIDIESVKDKINNKTLALVGIAGSTGLGTVDDIPTLSDIAIESKIHLHIDAAFGGFVLPFLSDLGYFQDSFDFKLCGVKSITIDPHKMGLCPIPSGAILFREQKLLSNITMKVDYIGKNGTFFNTLMCTRPAYQAIAVWLAMKNLGKNGYRKIVENCMINTLKLYHELKKLHGVKPLIRPTMNIIGFISLIRNNETVFKKLIEKGWYLSLFKTHIRIIVMPHTNNHKIDQFIKDLRTVIKEI